MAHSEDLLKKYPLLPNLPACIQEEISRIQHSMNITEVMITMVKIRREGEEDDERYRQDLEEKQELMDILYEEAVEDYLEALNSVNKKPDPEEGWVA
jgi:hypothetical protein